MIIAPVSRFLAVSNPERSIAFYRDLLGFEVQPVRGNYGFPAAAELVSGGTPAGGPGRCRAR